MDHAFNILTDYLKSPSTDYSILINSEWGSGKTFYAKETIPRIIRESIEKEPGQIKFIYLSVNGLEDLREIIKKIAVKRYNIGPKVTFFSKHIGTVINFGLEKAGLKNVDKLGISKIIESINLIDIMDLSNCVICFDDIERASEKISISDILGYINTEFVEHRKIKTILIADESKVKEKEKYFAIKEKLISRTINFTPNLLNIIINLINSHKADETFFDYLKINQDTIYDMVIQLRIRNIRTIKFFIEILNPVFKCEPSFQKNKLEEELIYFSLVICNEYRDGRLTLNNLEDRKRIDGKDVSSAYAHEKRKKKEEEEKKDPSYLTSFHEKYIRNSKFDYCFFKEIYYLILSGIFNCQNFRTEVSKILDASEKPWNLELNSIYRFRDLSDSEMISKTEKVIRFLKEGKYSLYAIPKIYDTVAYLIKSKIVLISESSLDEAIKLGLANSPVRVESFDAEANVREFLSTSTEDPKMDKIIHEVTRLHSMAKVSFQNDFSKELFLHLNKEKSESWIFLRQIEIRPFFNKVDMDWFVGEVVKLPNSSIDMLIAWIEDRYRTVNIGDYLGEESEALTKMSALIDEKTANLKSGVSFFLFRTLSEKTKKTSESLMKWRESKNKPK
jgi:hypothetical protein